MNESIERPKNNNKHSSSIRLNFYFPEQCPVKMKKFLYEYKSFRVRTDIEPSNRDKRKSRERITLTSRRTLSPDRDVVEEPNNTQSDPNVGTIRTEEYKRDLAEFQARRSSGPKDFPDIAKRELPDTPVKKSGRHSLPVSCTDCATDNDNTFNYEKKSASKYKKNKKRARSASEEPKESVPNIQFLFQNQVFMPGNVIGQAIYSEPYKTRISRQRVRHKSPDADFFTPKHIDFKEEDEQQNEPPLFYKNNSLPYDVQHFLEAPRSDGEEVDGLKAGGDGKVSSHSSTSVKTDSSVEKLVMDELNNFDQWADEQLKGHSGGSSKINDNKSEASTYGLPLVTSSDIDVTIDRSKIWNLGTWGLVPIQMKKLAGVTMQAVRNRGNVEIEIIRKCRHPNIILLMGVFPDAQGSVHIVCERCVDSLFNVLHVQGRLLSIQTSVQYALDIANALVFLRMRGYLHTAITSHSVMITARDAAKLAEFTSCAQLVEKKRREYREYETESHYVNIGDTLGSSSGDCEPLIADHPSEAYLSANAVAKPYKTYRDSELYRWQAPELFDPDEHGVVYPCSRSDVYSLSLVLWESCNASIPWKTKTYQALKEKYIEYRLKWNTGIRLPCDGRYPGCLLELMQQALELDRARRPDLQEYAERIRKVKRKLDDMEYMVIPARITRKNQSFSSTAWDPISPFHSDSDAHSPKNITHKAVIHKTADTSTESEDCKSETSPIYEALMKEPEKCFISEDETDERYPMTFEKLQDKELSSACSTPKSKTRAKISNVPAPTVLEKNGSTEYCSILSPKSPSFGVNGSQSAENPTAKLSRSFTPQSYKSLHIKVPEFNLEGLKYLPKEASAGRPSYNFDIKHYSLPATPIARSNKLRKNAWLSGDLIEEEGSAPVASKKEVIIKQVQSAPETPAPVSASSLVEKDPLTEDLSSKRYGRDEKSPESVDVVRDTFTGLRKTEGNPFSSPFQDTPERSRTWSFKSSERSPKAHHDKEDVLSSVNVKPLVAIHEKWIYEANKKTTRSMSLPETERVQSPAVKPASHCVDTWQKSLPEVNAKRPAYKYFRGPSFSLGPRTGALSEQFCAARATVARCLSSSTKELDRLDTRTWRREASSKSTSTEQLPPPKAETAKVDQTTDTSSIENFIRDMIRTELDYLLHQNPDNSLQKETKSEDLLNKGVANVLEALKNGDTEHVKKEIPKSFSRVKINGNNKPLVQITFSRSGENSLHVMDNCVNVTFCDAKSGKEKMDQSCDESMSSIDDHVQSLKRCQTFNALQEARSTEDLYIDDDLSTHMQENFGGKVKLIPLHGSLHEILCEREDDCCLVKVKQENGCDTIFFRCDNSDTESRDAPDGATREHDTVVYKRSISVIEEKIERVIPKRVATPVMVRRTTVDLARPKSDIVVNKLERQTRFLSNSSPSLTNNNDEVELNIENVMSYQDSSSDECLNPDDDFELIEQEIEQDVACATSIISKCLDKIPEEHLYVIDEESSEREASDCEGTWNTKLEGIVQVVLLVSSCVLLVLLIKVLIKNVTKYRRKRI